MYRNVKLIESERDLNNNKRTQKLNFSTDNNNPVETEKQQKNLQVHLELQWAF